MANAPSETRPDGLSVLLTNKKRGWSGETAYIYELIRGYRARGVPVALATREGAELTARTEALGVPVHELHFDPRSGGVTAKRRDARTLRTIAAEHRVNVLHTNASWDTWVSMVALRRARGIVRIRTKHNVKAIRKHLMNRWLYGRLIQRLIAPSKTVLAHLEEARFIDMGKVRHLPLGIPLDRFRIDDDRRPDARRRLADELGVAADALGFVACYVSRVTDRKHPEDLVRAARALGADAGVRAVFVGSGDTEALAAEARGLDHVHILGHRDDPVPYFAAADAFVLPSPHEPFGLAAVEAMAAGTPVVLPRAGGFVEIARDGEDGLLYDPADPVDGLAAALVTLRDDPARATAMGRAGRVRATETFDADAMVDRTLAFYREVAPSPTPVAAGA